MMAYKKQSTLQFIGYKTDEINLLPLSVRSYSQLELKIDSSDFIKESNIYQITIVVKFGSPKEDKYSSLKFLAGFKMDDDHWKTELKQNDDFESICFSIAFPFIREKVFAITNDSFNGLMIPTIDLRMFNLRKGIKLMETKRPKK
jgi:preprotein translocase subunit SecB